MTSVSGPPPNRRPGAPLTMIAGAAVPLVAGPGGAGLGTTPSASSAANSQATPAPSAAAASPTPGSAPSRPWPAFRGPIDGGPFGAGGFAARTAPRRGQQPMPAG
ncbi:MAG TPA: hypothetical protein VMH35_02820 [Streptosporangiaceae bacterium]|nr:hypothetical protein [Streptosporangiaceae bacterium]